MTNHTEMPTKTEIWDMNIVKCYFLVYIIIFDISDNRVKFVSFSLF